MHVYIYVIVPIFMLSFRWETSFELLKIKKHNEGDLLIIKMVKINVNGKSNERKNFTIELKQIIKL
jgi:hypothetical protein